MKEISRLHGIPKAIVSVRNPDFTLNFWKGLFKEFGTKLNLNKTYHPHSDGKTELVNQIIEDMIRMYMMDNPSK